MKAAGTFEEAVHTGMRKLYLMSANVYVEVAC